MPRKRKVATVQQDTDKMPPPPVPPAKAKPARKNGKVVANKENADVNVFRVQNISPVAVVCQKAQTNESLHPKYFKELQSIYEKMQHENFMSIFLKCLRVNMKEDESNSFANLGLKFFAKFLTSLQDDGDTHPILVSTFDFLLSTFSPLTTVRFRLCQFVNLLLSSMPSEAALDDNICNDIIKYMADRLKDQSALVRVQAVQALQRLQSPDVPSDLIVRAYLFHLANDVSAQVRMAVITAIGRTYRTIPPILERLWDIDERVRRHTYLQMSSYPVKSYKVAQRITFLEQGLNDHSEGVRKIVTSILLPQWLQSYGKNYISFVTALKLDASTAEIERFMKISKQALFVIFKKESVNDLIAALPLSENGEEMEKCVPLDKLTIEVAVYWQALVEYLQSNGDAKTNNHDDDTDDDDADSVDRVQDIICDLSAFCDYLTKFCAYVDDLEKTNADDWLLQDNKYKFMILIEILLTFDLGDEIGRQNLKAFISNVLSTQILEPDTIQKLVQCVENLMPDATARLQYFVDIVRACIDPRTAIDFTDRSVTELIDSIKDPNLKMLVSKLKLEILDLNEQETVASQEKDYARLEKISEELALKNEEINRLLAEYEKNHSTSMTINSTLSSMSSRKATPESIQQCLQICYYAVASKNTKTLTPSMCQLYKDFIRRQMESKHMSQRDWGLKAGIACSMLYEQLARDVFGELTSQFFKHHITRIWATSITGTFELLDRYGFMHFEKDMDGDKNSAKTKKTRQLYNTMDYLEEPEEDEGNTSFKAGQEIMYLFGHFLDTCQDTAIIRALTLGFCRLVLGGHSTNDLISKLLIKFFNPATDPEVNQVLGVFFEALVKRRQQECLAKALLPTLNIILEAPNDSPLRELRPETVIRFVVRSTIPAYCSPGLNIHNDIALSFLSVMNDSASNQGLLKLLSKELLTLEMSDDTSLRADLQRVSDNLLDQSIVDQKTKSYIKSFKEILAGTYKASVVENKLNEDGDIDDEAVDEEDKIEDEDKETDDGNDDKKMVEKNTSIMDETTLHTINDTLDTKSESDIKFETSEIEHETDHELPLTPPEEFQNDNNVPNQSGFSSDEENRVTSTQKSARNDGRPAKESTTKTPNKEKNTPAVKEKTKANSKSVEDNNENDEVPLTPTEISVASCHKTRNVFVTKHTNSPSRTPTKKSSGTSPQKLKEKNSRVAAKTNKTKATRIPEPVVRLTRLELDKNQNPLRTHHTRNALVAEFKNTNVMTRKRLSIEQAKSPTQRVSMIRRITANSTPSPPASRKSSVSSSSSSSPRAAASSKPAPSPRRLIRSSDSQSSQSSSNSSVSTTKSPVAPARGLKRGRPARENTVSSSSSSPTSPRTSTRLTASSTRSSPTVTPDPKRRASAGINETKKTPTKATVAQTRASRNQISNEIVNSQKSSLNKSAPIATVRSTRSAQNQNNQKTTRNRSQSEKSSARK